MAEQKPAPEVTEYDDDGKPIVKVPVTPPAESPAPGTEKKGEEDKEKKPDAEPDFDDTATPVIPIRNSVAQHIIARKNEKIKKLESKVDAPENNADDTPDAEDDLSDQARGAIDKAVEQRIKPLVETLASTADENELKELFATEPEAKKYEKHIKAYMGHEAYKGVSPVVIYHHLAFNQAQAVGAKKKKVADLEAGQARSGGRGLPAKGAPTDLPSAEDIAGMSEAEFEAMELSARQGNFIKK